MVIKIRLFVIMVMGDNIVMGIKSDIFIIYKVKLLCFVLWLKFDGW